MEDNLLSGDVKSINGAFEMTGEEKENDGADSAAITTTQESSTAATMTTDDGDKTVKKKRKSGWGKLSGFVKQTFGKSSKKDDDGAKEGSDEQKTSSAEKGEKPSGVEADGIPAPIACSYYMSPVSPSWEKRHPVTTMYSP